MTLDSVEPTPLPGRQDRIDQGAAVTRRLIHSDCLDALLDERMVTRGSVGLAYLDPPFATERGFEAGLRRLRGETTPGQTTAFDDRWGAYRPRLALPKTVESVVSVSASVAGPNMGGYVRFMAERLFALSSALSPQASVYVHVAPTCAPYLRLVLDAVLGPKTFRNEIAWKRTHAHSGSRRYGPVHDSILFYARSGYAWHRPTAPTDPAYAQKHYRSVDASGRRYQLVTPTGSGDRTGTEAHYQWKGRWPPAGRHWAWRKTEMERLESLGLLQYSKKGTVRRVYYLSDYKGTPLQDVWTDVPRLDAHSDERVGFETQKPLTLLSRIIKASAPANGEAVLDGFVGTGTSILAAENAGLPWIGIDASLKSIAIALGRAAALGHPRAIALHGGPTTAPEAEHLAKVDADAFGLWATACLGLHLDHKLTAPGAIYGRSAQTPLLRAVAAADVSRSHLEQLAGADATRRYAIGLRAAYSHPRVARLSLSAMIDKLHSGLVPVPPEEVLT